MMNKTPRDISVIAMLKEEWTPVPIKTTTKIKTKISIISSKVPIPIMLCPNFVLIILNSSKIGIKIASPTVAKDKATREDMNQEYPKTKCIKREPKIASKKMIKKIALKIKFLLFFSFFKSISNPIMKSRKYIPNCAKNSNIGEEVIDEKGL